MKTMGPIPAGYGVTANGHLEIDGRDIEELVARAGGTPLFVYDNNLVGAKIAQFRAAMPDGVALHYAVKANPYPELLHWLSKHVDGFDVASQGELDQLERAGASGVPISFAGPGKSDGELRRAISQRITLNVESEAEAGRAIRIGGSLGIQPRLAVRVNPPFSLKGAGMKMGGHSAPFGVDDARVPDLVRGIVESGAQWRGLHIYAGSQVLDADALVDAQRETIELAALLSEQAGFAPPEVNLGGGFGIPYFANDRPLDVEKVGKALNAELTTLPPILAHARFAIELGRWLVGEAGVYITRIVDRKVSRDRTFLVTDGGLNHMLAASGNFGQLLRRNYPVAIATRFGAEPDEEASIVGPLCTPLDLLADEVSLPEAAAGDLVAVFCAGAYGLTASPQSFLGQAPAREVLV